MEPGIRADDTIHGYDVSSQIFTTSSISLTTSFTHTNVNEVNTHCVVDCEVERDIIFEPFVSVIYGALFAIVTIPAFLCNVLVILTFSRYNHMRTPVNTYIVNLAVCDLLLLTLECQPVIVQYLLPTEWSRHVVNDVSCTLFFFFNTFFGTAAIMTLLALSVERFCCVIHPVTTMAFATRTGTRAKFIIVLVWCAALLPHFGNCVLFDTVKREKHPSRNGDHVYDVTFCVSKKADESLFYGSFYTASVFVLLYASTFITTLTIYLKIIRKLKERKFDRFPNGSFTQHNRSRRGSAHDRARKQTSKLLYISFFSYIVFYTFYFYVNFYYVYFGLYIRQGFTMILIANWFGALNACINPFMHAVFVSKFRRGIVMFLHCRTAGSRRVISDRSRGSVRWNSCREIRSLSNLDNHSADHGHGDDITLVPISTRAPLEL